VVPIGVQSKGASDGIGMRNKAASVDSGVDEQAVGDEIRAHGAKAQR
jgi:hypothetical protein